MSEINPRDYAAERRASLENRAQRLGQLKDDLLTGKLAEESVHMAKVMLLCTLPYSRPKVSQLTRTARLGDDSTLQATFTAAIKGVGLPFGSDRRLLAWLLNRSFKQKTPLIPWDSAYEYIDEIGRKSKSGRTYQQLKDSLIRLSGLAVNLTGAPSFKFTQGDTFSIIRKYHLPNFISSHEAHNDKIVPISDDSTILHGVLIDPIFHSDLLRSGSNVAIPYELWMTLKGNSQFQDMVLFFYWRCYSAASESVIPWEALADQFGHSSNPRRQRDYARQAVTFLRSFWPGCKIEAIDTGILVDRSQPLLPNDPARKRIRMLGR
jgi:hypothetical protein